MTGSIEPPAGPGRGGPVGPDDSRRAARGWWDSQAVGYQAEHGAFLGDIRFLWGPEGLDEAEAALLGDVSGLRVLEVGAGAAACARWLLGRGARVVALDLSGGQLAQAALADARAGVRVAAVQADAAALPFRAAAVDLAFSAYGALPFVSDLAAVHAEVARVLRPGGRWVFSVPHPVRWAFPDDPGPRGLTATTSYFDRSPYAEYAADGTLAYVEHHRTLGDHVRALVGAGFVLEDLVEPPWPAGHDRTWGGWSPLRGRLLPGTAIFVARRSRAM